MAVRLHPRPRPFPQKVAHPPSAISHLPDFNFLLFPYALRPRKSQFRCTEVYAGVFWCTASDLNRKKMPETVKKRSSIGQVLARPKTVGCPGFSRRLRSQSVSQRALMLTCPSVGTFHPLASTGPDVIGLVVAPPPAALQLGAFALNQSSRIRSQYLTVALRIAEHPVPREGNLASANILNGIGRYCRNCVAVRRHFPFPIRPIFM